MVEKDAPSCSLPLNMNKEAHCPRCCWHWQPLCNHEESPIENKRNTQRKAEPRELREWCLELALPLGMVIDFLNFKAVLPYFCYLLLGII